MVLGNMQPYFFPYLGYFDLINRCDRWIVFDTPQYIKQGWVNRNRVLHPADGWTYFGVPVRKHEYDTPICRIETSPPTEWRPKLLRQLLHYQKRAPHFDETMTLVTKCLSDNDPNLSRLNTRILGEVCRHIGIPWNFAMFSEMNLPIGPVEGPGDWSLRICQALGATEYINPPGGAALFDRSEFHKSGIRLTIQEPFEFSYDCPGYEFQPSLSVIDALMWNGPARLKAHLDQVKARSTPNRSR
jgi:hypothetical protein